MENKQPEIIKGLRLENFINDYISSLEHPFLDNRSRILAPFMNLGKNFARSLENLLGSSIYINKRPSPLDHIPPKFRKVAARLAEAGILTRCYRLEAIPDWPEIPVFQLTCGRLNAHGCALSYEEAFQKATAECMERHSLMVYDPKKFTHGTWEKLEPQSALDPRLFCGFSDHQLQEEGYARHRLDENPEFMWTETKSIFDQKKYLIPAQLVYLGYRNEREEPLIRQTTTNGAAAGSSWEMALYNALCETVERDSFMIHWLNKITPPRIDLAGVSDGYIRRLWSEYKKFDVDLAVFDITTDLKIPTVLTVIRDSSPQRIKVYVAPRTDLDVERAIRSSLYEAQMPGVVAAATTDAIKIINEKGNENIGNIEDRRTYWSDPARLKEASFLYGGALGELRTNEYRGANFKKKLPVLKEILKNAGLDAYAAEVTTPLAKELGLTVLTSLVPGLYPLYLDEHYKYLGIKRLYEAPVRMGVLEKPKKEEEMNPIPHPML